MIKKIESFLLIIVNVGRFDCTVWIFTLNVGVEI